MAGRDYTIQKAGISFWVYDSKKFVKDIEIEEQLPAQDCSYCGLEVNSEGEGLLSYYKGTTDKAGIWLGIFEEC